ncbi:MAG: regulatory protein RecX [Acidobacteriota bacterium]
MKTVEKKIYQRALGFLARRNHSRRELHQKLVRSHQSDLVEEILDQLEERGFLNDATFALERALLGRKRRLWGDHRVSQDLKRLGIDAKMIDEVLEQINQEKGEVEGLQEAIDLWVNRSGEPKTHPPLKKLYDHCIRLGYAPDRVRTQLGPYFDDVDWSRKDENGR